MAAFFDKDNLARRPGFRSRRGPQGFVIRDTKVRRLSRKWGEVLVPKCGWVRFRWTRPLPRISDRDTARYLGLQRKLARQQKESRRREKTRAAMAEITARLTDRRKDWAEKTSTRLIRSHDVIVLEKLNTPGMVRRPAPRPDTGNPGVFLPNRARAKAGLNRGILASCWGTLARRLEQKAAASGAAVVFVDPHFTSQRCRMCGHTASENRESQAVFRCVSCGHSDHADANAARNILARGLALTSGVPARARGQASLRPRKTPESGAAGTTRQAA
jgi:putative transposase